MLTKKNSANQTNKMRLKRTKKSPALTPEVIAALLRPFFLMMKLAPINALDDKAKIKPFRLSLEKPMLNLLSFCACLDLLSSLHRNQPIISSFWLIIFVINREYSPSTSCSGWMREMLACNAIQLIIVCTPCTSRGLHMIVIHNTCFLSYDSLIQHTFWSKIYIYIIYYRINNLKIILLFYF